MLVDHKYTQKKETYKTVYTSTLTYLDKYKELKLEVRRLLYMNILGTTCNLRIWIRVSTST